MNYIIENKEWIFSGLGVFIISATGTGLYLLGQLFWRRFYVFPKIINKYKGVYDAFYFMPYDSKTIKKAGLEIYWSWFKRRVRVKLKSDNYVFVGKLSKKEHNIIIDLWGDNYRKMPMSIIFIEPLIEDFEIMLGTFNTVTLNSTPFAGKFLLKKVPLRTVEMVSIKEIPVHKINSDIKNYLTISSSESIVANNVDNPFST
jgi:hypothetical protein